MKKNRDWLLVATTIFLATAMAGCRIHTDKQDPKQYSVQLAGKILVSPQTEVKCRIEYKHVVGNDYAYGNWHTATAITVPKPQELCLDLTIPAPAEIAGAARCLLRITYYITDHLTQSKVVYASSGKIDLGCHRPVIDSEENMGDYQKLVELLQSGDEYQAVDYLKDIRVAPTSPFYNCYLATLTVLAARFGDWAYLTSLTTTEDSASPDRFWPSYLACHPRSPFSLQIFSREESAVGPFEPGEFSLAQISDACRGLTRHPVLELNKYLLSPNYRQLLASAPADYYRMFRDLPFVVDGRQQHKSIRGAVDSGNNALAPYTAAMRSTIATFAAIGPRKIGDLAARKLVADGLGRYVLPGFQLRQENFAVRHSHHGLVTLVNFYIEPHYPCQSRLLLCTHYDSFSGDFADPGANNGLSGVLAMVYLMQDRRLMTWCRENQIGISWHFYDGETAGEPGRHDEYFLGSKYFTRRYPERARKFSFVLCPDMVGATFSYDHIVHCADPELTQATLQIARSMGARIGLQSAINDDHLAYHLLKVPATLLISYHYPYYHSIEDSIDKLNPCCLLGTASLLRNTILSRFCR